MPTCNLSSNETDLIQSPLQHQNMQMLFLSYVDTGTWSQTWKDYYTCKGMYGNISFLMSYRPLMVRYQRLKGASLLGHATCQSLFGIIGPCLYRREAFLLIYISNKLVIKLTPSSFCEAYCIPFGFYHFNLICSK